MTRAFVIALLALPLLMSCAKEKGCTDPASVNYDPAARKSSDNCVTVEKQQLYLLTEFTAIWCPPCGSWGAEAFRQMLADYPDKVIGMAVHGSSSQPDVLTIAAGNELLSGMYINAFPSFRLGTVPVGSPANLSTAFQVYDNNPIAASGACVYTFGDAEVAIDARVQFYEASSDPHYLAFYLLEDDIPGGDNASGAYNQQGDNTNDYTHDHTLRGAAGDKGFGLLINNTPVTASTAENMAATITIPPDMVRKNAEVIGVIWKKQGNAWIFVNAFHGVDSDSL